jgi:hypothetical protein
MAQDAIRDYLVSMKKHGEACLRHCRILLLLWRLPNPRYKGAQNGMTQAQQSRIALRLPQDLRERIQQLAEHWPGRPSESCMIRYLIERALDDAERERMGTP